MVSSVNNYNRISGLASGLDTETIVKQMVQAQSTKLFKLQQSKTLNSWKTDAYREINTKLDEFRKSMEGLRLQSTFNKRTITASKPDLVGVSISGVPTHTSYTITSATLAKDAQAASVSLSAPARTEKAIEDFSFNLTGTGTATIEIKKDETVDQMIAKINSQSSTTGIRASYFEGNGSIILTTVATGEAANITIDSATTNNLGIVDGTIKTAEPTEKFAKYSEGSNGVTGKVTINGLELEINNNSFVYDGMKIDLKSNIEESNPVTLQTSVDTQGVFDSIKTFVEKYNELISDLNKRISEKKYRDFPPLLEEQKKEMKENEIKLWEEKARSGLLKGDSTISGLLSNLRSSILESVGGITEKGIPKSLSDIGITTSKSYSDNGKLELDETKLKSVLDSNLEAVKNLFTKRSPLGESKDTTATNIEKHNDSGYGWRIYDRINVTISNLASIAGSPNSSVDTTSLLAKQLRDINQNLDREQDKISRYETNLYKKFTELEKAMTKFNNQSSWLAQQLGI